MPRWSKGRTEFWGPPTEYDEIGRTTVRGRISQASWTGEKDRETHPRALYACTGDTSSRNEHESFSSSIEREVVCGVDRTVRESRGGVCWDTDVVQSAGGQLHWLSLGGGNSGSCDSEGGEGGEQH